MAKKNTAKKLELPSGNGSINVRNSEIKKVTLANQQLTPLKNALKSFENSISAYNSALKTFMTGNAGEAYWQGTDAYDWFDDAVGVLRTLINNYLDFYFCAEQYAKLVAQAEALKKGKGKKIPQAVLNMVRYKDKLSGIVPNLDNYKISGVVGVDKDKVTTLRTKEAGRSFKNMRNALDGVSSSCTAMANAWAAIAKNTKGGISNFATNRAQKRCSSRKTAINAVKTDMDDYTFDLLFNV